MSNNTALRNVHIRRLILWVSTGLLALNGLYANAGTTIYRFSPVNQYDINLTAAYWNPIISYVAEKSGVKLILKIGRTSADTTSYVLAREVDFALPTIYSPQSAK